MAKRVVDFGFTAPQYYYWATYDDGSKHIENGSWNLVMNKYKAVYEGDDEYDVIDVWDTLREYKKTSYENYRWYEDNKHDPTISADGKTVSYWSYVWDGKERQHPTVSGDGAQLTGSAGDDMISNTGHYYLDYDGNLFVFDYGEYFYHPCDYCNVHDDSDLGGKNVTIDGGKGNDGIHNNGDSALINAGADDDYISNSGANSEINGDSGKDYIYNSGNNVKINGGSDHDIISNSGDNSNINAGSGKDFIGNGGSTVTIKAGAGKDTVNNSGSNVSISGG